MLKTNVRYDTFRRLLNKRGFYILLRSESAVFVLYMRILFHSVLTYFTKVHFDAKKVLFQL